MVKMTNQIGLVQTVAQCIKDAEGTIEKIKEQYPRGKKKPGVFRGGSLSPETLTAVGNGKGIEP